MNFENDGNVVVEKIVYYVEEGFWVVVGNVELENNKVSIYLVVCVIFFFDEIKVGEVLLMDDYMVEMKIFYVVDLGKFYCFIEESMFKKV